MSLLRWLKFWRSPSEEARAEPVPSRALPPGSQWIGHCGAKARERYLRQRIKRLERQLTKPADFAAVERCYRAVADDPDPAQAMRNLMLAAEDAAEGVRASGGDVHLGRGHGSPSGQLRGARLRPRP